MEQRTRLPASLAIGTSHHWHECTPRPRERNRPSAHQRWHPDGPDLRVYHNLMDMSEDTEPDRSRKNHFGTVAPNAPNQRTTLQGHHIWGTRYNVAIRRLILRSTSTSTSTHSDPEVEIGPAFGMMFVKHVDSESLWKSVKVEEVLCCCRQYFSGVLCRR